MIKKTLPKKTKKKNYAPKNLNNLSIKNSIEHTQFIGSGEDILLSFIYLYKKHKTFYLPLGNLKNYNIDLMWNIAISYKCNKKKTMSLNYPLSETDYFKKLKKFITNYEKNKKRKFILIPTFLGTNDCNIYKGHFNILIFNIPNMTIERFEPYGTIINLKEHKSFDKKLLKVFLKHKINIKLITPNKFMKNKSFQSFEEEEIEKKISSLRTSDPGGFCGVWGIWFSNMRLKYPDLSTKDLIDKTEKILKSKTKFRNFIRNYSQYLIKERKKLLNGTSLKYFTNKELSEKLIYLTKN